MPFADSEIPRKSTIHLIYRCKGDRVTAKGKRLNRERRKMMTVHQLIEELKEIEKTEGEDATVWAIDQKNPSLVAIVVGGMMIKLND